MALLGSAALLYLILSAMRRSSQDRRTGHTERTPVAAEEALEPYLERVDREMESMGVAESRSAGEKDRS